MLSFGTRGCWAVPAQRSTYVRACSSIVRWPGRPSASAPARRQQKGRGVERQRVPGRELPRHLRETQHRQPLPTTRQRPPAPAHTRPKETAVKEKREDTGWKLPSLKEHKLELRGAEERKRQAANYKFRRNPAMQLRDLALQGKASEALELFERTPKTELRRDTFVFNQLLLACARAGAWNRSFKVFNRLKKHAVEPDLRTFSMLVDCLANVVHEPSVTPQQRIVWTRKRLDYVADQLHARGMRPNAQLYNVVFKTLAAVGDINGALSLLREMDLGKEAGAVGGGVFGTGGRKGETEEEEESGKTGEAKPRADLMTYTTLVKLFGQHSAEQAFSIWDKMRSNTRVKPDTRFYNALAAVSIKHKKAEVCLEVLEEMTAKHRLKPDAVSLTHMTAAFAAMGRPAYAPVILQRAEESGVVPDPFLLSAVLRLGTQKSWAMRRPIEDCPVQTVEQFVEVMEKKLARADGSVSDAHAHMFLVGCTHAAMPSRAVYYFKVLTDRNKTIDENLHQKLASACKKHGTDEDSQTLAGLYSAQRLLAQRRAGKGPPRVDSTSDVRAHAMQ